MKKTTSDNIRNTFINFFKKNSHKEAKSSPLIPTDDPSILLTNAGMVQFKKCFTGEEVPAAKNIVSIQKCMRAGGKHNDLDNVGYTPRHHTFFEMLGNFSFGGYFKEKAISLAWDLLTKEFCLSKDRLIITVYKDDQDSYDIWKKISGFSDHRIVRISTNDNFWSMGDTGPCGPCSEIFFDNGSKINGGLPGSKNEDGDRYVEIWNLVFMEFDKQNGQLKKLPEKCVDTGMGLERISAVLSGEVNNYNTDLFKFIFNKIGLETATTLHSENLVAYRIISDHIKSIIFLMSEGILPSNEGRGYVLRRIIRRALLNVNKLKSGSIILHKLVDEVIEKYLNFYYELEKTSLFIKKNLRIEEEKFSETLSFGLDMLYQEITKLDGSDFSADIAYKLYDTYGFPVDMTESILREKKIKIDMKKYNSIVKKNREMQRKSWKGEGKKIQTLNHELLKEIEETNFCGYDLDSCESKLLRIIENDEIKTSSNKCKDTILIFNKTPFYAESGGQVGDSGKIYDKKNQLLGEISDTKKIGNNIFLHFMKNCHKEIKINRSYFLKIDKTKRNKVRNNHSATHLLHESLRQTLGKHVAQRGSLVNHQKLRFDYTSNEQLSDDNLKKVEKLVNNSIRSNTRVEIKKMPVRKAIEGGAIALFGEKYPDVVRVVSMINDKKNNSLLSSIELCGGTHVDFTGEIGTFKILNEMSISSGVRRIEALTGEDADLYSNEKFNILKKLKEILKVSDDNIIEKVETLKNEIASKSKNELSGSTVFSKSKIQKVSGVSIYYDNIKCSPKDLRNNSDNIKKTFNSGIIILSTCKDKKVSVVVAVTEDLLEKFDSNKIIKNLIVFLGGKGGGGRKDLSQGGADLNDKFKTIHENLEKIIF